MIDIHCHILPMIDDGASNVEMALDLLDEAARNKTSAIVFTPHFSEHTSIINVKSRIRPLYKDMCRIAYSENIPIKIYLGTEYLYVSERHFEEYHNQIQTMNDTEYLLTEFYFDEDEEFILHAIDNVIKHGFIPIVAHPERYDILKYNPSFFREMKKHGALLQMNKGSVLGVHGEYSKEAAFELLNHRAYSFVGSDAHSTRMRNSSMIDTYHIVSDTFGDNYTQTLFLSNPDKMLRGIDIRKRAEIEKIKDKE